MSNVSLGSLSFWTFSVASGGGSGVSGVTASGCSFSDESGNVAEVPIRALDGRRGQMRGGSGGGSTTAPTLSWTMDGLPKYHLPTK